MCVIQHYTVHNCTTHSFHHIHHSTDSHRTTYADRLRTRVRTSRHDHAIGVIRGSGVVYYTYDEVMRMVNGMCTLIRRAYAGTACGQRIGILMDNCIEWTVTDLALIMTGNVSVPIYATFGREGVARIIAENGIRMVVAGHGSVDMLRDVEVVRVVVVCRSERRDVCMDGKTVWYYDGLSVDTDDHTDVGVDKDRDDNVDVGVDRNDNGNADVGRDVSRNDNADVDKDRNDSADVDINDSLMTIIYSSGTTGTPKPVPLTHNNVMSSIDSLIACTRTFMPVSSSDVHLSYLPLAHIMERLLVYAFLLMNVRVVYYSGSRKRVISDMRIVRPSVLIGAPRVWQMIRDRLAGSVVVRMAVAVLLLFNGHTDDGHTDDGNDSMVSTGNGNGHMVSTDNGHTDNGHTDDDHGNAGNGNTASTANTVVSTASTIIANAVSLVSAIITGIASLPITIATLILSIITATTAVSDRAISTAIRTNRRVMDMLVCRRIRQSFGDNVRLLFSGSAYLRDDLKQLMTGIFNVPMYEAYGSTETTGVVSVSVGERGVGWPIFMTEMRMVGEELVVRGDNVCMLMDDSEYVHAGCACVPATRTGSGDERHSPFITDGMLNSRWYAISRTVYDRNEKEGRINYDYKEIRMDGDGADSADSTDGHTKCTDSMGSTSSRETCTGRWFRTGDGVCIRNGNVHIVSRMKNNFKTSQGEYIVPEKIEKEYKMASSMIMDMFVTGDRSKSYIVGIVVSRSRDMDREMARVGEVLKREGRLAGFEVVRKYVVIGKRFEEYGCVTASTGKICRRDIERVFADMISRMYDD